jgi:hypothetical protein
LARPRPLHQAQHLVGFDAALDRAAERRAQANLDDAARAARVAQVAHARDLVHRVVGRLAQVGQAVRVARRQRQQHRVRARVDGAFGAFQVGHQHRHREAGQLERVRDQLGGVGKLRHQPGRHERADLELAHAGGVRAAQPLQLEFGRQRARQDLQPVAQADLAQRDRGVHGGSVIDHGA